ncbi:MAG: cyanophycinase [Pirellulales bacterium]
MTGHKQLPAAIGRFRQSATLCGCFVLVGIVAWTGQPPRDHAALLRELARPLGGRIVVTASPPTDNLERILGDEHRPRRIVVLDDAAAARHGPTSGRGFDTVPPSAWEHPLAEVVVDRDIVWVQTVRGLPDRVVAGLRAIVDRGGVVAGSQETMAAVAGFLVSVSTDDEEAAVAHTLAGRPGAIGIRVPPGATAILAGRRATAVGGATTWYLPCPSAAAAPDADVDLTVRQEAGRPVDVVALRRRALARLDPTWPPQHPSPAKVGSGTLLLGGGGDYADEFWKRFIELAGGLEAPIVVITAARPEADDGDPKGLAALERLGCRDITVLDERTPDDVDGARFRDALGRARGVWLVGGRQWRYLDAFDGTCAGELLRGVLARGGVVGGTSAGAAVQAEFMVRGSPLGNRIVSAAGYDRGLGLLPGTMIDIHVGERGRLDEFAKLVARHPQFLGIAIDERTVAEVRGSRLTALGDGVVRLVDARTGKIETTELRAPAHAEIASPAPLSR